MDTSESSAGTTTTAGGNMAGGGGFKFSTELSLEEMYGLTAPLSWLWCGLDSFPDLIARLLLHSASWFFMHTYARVVGRCRLDLPQSEAGTSITHQGTCSLPWLVSQLKVK